LDLLLFAFVGYLVSQILSAYKWRVLAQPLGFSQPFQTFVVYYFAGMYLNLFAPSTVVGDVGRGALLARKGKNIGAALQSVLVDRVSGLVMLIWVSATGFLLFGPTVLPPLLSYGVITTAVLTGIGWWTLAGIVDRLLSPQNQVRHLIERTIEPYQTQALVLGRACVLSFVFHLFQLGLQLLLARAISLAVPFWYLILCIPLVHIASALPVSFGGIGVREGGYVMFLALIGVQQDEALVFGFLWSTLVLGAGLVGGLVFVFSPDTRFSTNSSSQEKLEIYD
jgi:hypothetical protein